MGDFVEFGGLLMKIAVVGSRDLAPSEGQLEEQLCLADEIVSGRAKGTKSDIGCAKKINKECRVLLMID